MLLGHAHAVHTRRWEVEDRRHEETNEVPDATQTANPAPCAVVCNQLAPEHRGTERNDRENQNRHIFAALPRGSELRRDSQSRQLVDPRADSGEYHSSDEDVHGFSSRTDDHAQADEGGTHNRDISAADEIRNGADEGTDAGEGEQIGKHEPNPAIRASNVAVDVRWDATEEVYRNLAASPYCREVSTSKPSYIQELALTKRHGYQTHRPAKAHLRYMLVVLVIAVGSEAVLLVVVRVAWDPLLGVDLLDVLHATLWLGCRRIRGILVVVRSYIALPFQSVHSPGLLLRLDSSLSAMLDENV